jgi:hypothetical protein
MARRISECINCHEERPVVAFGLCNKCYQHEAHAAPDRHNPGIRREQKKLFRGLASIMCGLGDLGVSRVDAKDIRAKLEPYLEPIAELLESDPKLPRNSRGEVPVDQEFGSFGRQK